MKKIAREVLKKLEFNQAELSIRLVNNREIKTLNRKYRLVNRVTDVLAFPQSERGMKAFHPELLGDVVISFPQARFQARLLEHSFKKEMAVLVVHGILHLLGFEDESKKGKGEMFRRQRQLVEWIEKKGLL
ncbi:MAG: rRNA maturation RNase YbeY [Candidatus Ratteibacteria bacterium]|nr:rRNA maturation RNase YbeY [Candidatus Ratteibacteria bacterium]